MIRQDNADFRWNEFLTSAFGGRFSPETRALKGNETRPKFIFIFLSIVEALSHSKIQPTQITMAISDQVKRDAQDKLTRWLDLEQRVVSSFVQRGA